MVPAGFLELRLKQNNYEDVRRHPPESLIGWVFSVSEENMSTERGKENGSRKSIAGSMLAAACTLLAVVAMSPDAYAGFGSEMSNVGSIIQKLAVCGGALGPAFSGMELAYGDEQTAAKAKKKIIVIIAATAAVFALPMVIQWAQGIASGSAWSPQNMH